MRHPLLAFILCCGTLLTSACSTSSARPDQEPETIKLSVREAYTHAVTILAAYFTHETHLQTMLAAADLAPEIHRAARVQLSELQSALAEPAAQALVVLNGTQKAPATASVMREWVVRSLTEQGRMPAVDFTWTQLNAQRYLVLHQDIWHSLAGELGHDISLIKKAYEGRVER